MSEAVDFLNLLLVIAIKCNLRQFRKMGRYCNDYYEKFPEAIKLKCGHSLDYIIKYVSCKKNEQLQLQVSNICRIALEVLTNVSYMSVVCGNNFGTRFQ